MPHGVVRFVPLFREIALDPLHNLGQRGVFAGFYEDMDMVVHHGEVPNLDLELRFGFFDEIKEHLLDFRAFQGHYAMVNLRRDMVGGLGL
jgi:hypothetical protein